MEEVTKPAEAAPSREGDARPPSTLRLALAMLGLAIVVLLLVNFRRGEPAVAEDDAEVEGPRRVLVAAVRRAPPELVLRLPGSTRADEEAIVRARASGYVARLDVDLGARVRAGQVLAEIRAPETMDELRAAEARVAQATESARWARESGARTTDLSGRGIATRQEADDAMLAVATAEASLRASEADAARLRSMRRYQTVVAPFDGVITERLVDLGALVTSAGSASDGLFRLSSVDRIEVVVDVPQTYAALVSPGQTIQVSRPDAPSETVDATIVRVAGALTESTRTMRVEAELPAGAGLLGGMFVDTRVHVERPAPPVIIPSRALSVTATGPRVWVVRDGTVHPVEVSIARDLGRELELSTGPSEGESVVLSPPDRLADGDAVSVVERPQPAAR